MNKTFTIYSFTLFLFLPLCTWANNLQIGDITLTRNNDGSQSAQISFSVDWENSWRVNSGQNNWDAVWLFVKFKNQDSDYWQHATLSNGSGHTADNGGQIDTSNDTGDGYAQGAFLYSSSTKTQGAADYEVSLRWEYGVDQQGEGDLFEINVYGIEMVYVPQGRYSLGTGGGENNTFYLRYNDGGSKDKPYVVSTEDAITVGTEYGNLHWDLIGPVPGDWNSGTIPAAFPKGYQSFYCMKYEVTQGQYADFLNTLTSDQVGENDYPVTVYNGTNRNGLRQIGDEFTSDHPYLPLFYSSHKLLFNYLDWACLRPMTEFEYEKACRGTEDPVAREFSWGTSLVSTDDYSITDNDLSSEYISANYSDTDVNASTGNSTIDENNDVVLGPTRVGIFATSTSNRIEAGASYYGIMDMTGNVWEMVITVSYEEGHSFDGSHGNGNLDNIGNYTISGWPNISASNPATGIRGGSFENTQDRAYISARGYIGEDFSTSSGRSFVGGRGVRTAPNN
ncbi:formylglycine-generating enzyme family protein [Flammeovirga agarivorans]|uniref:SUMF1/EgtB/PvdO family nonheme iron enzyme n=1 Tax=Flammeovirga agarivorans TaxID=2726742 RepID=A0A7X8SN66_9BACT|nr:SUMF1/EgtB/PvdO family nonheme iron enzyme [Flammeovirga agarivorans]NLR93309.1 SUMF1/EgtB/PvdO family nonheme iron enzyme [Flammeovirga agarivorans]